MHVISNVVKYEPDNKRKKGIIMQFETLQKDMVAAMKARDKARKDAISSLVSDVNE